jgi:hypothetical protein
MAEEPDGDKPQIEWVRKELKKSGYPLEMRVAATMRAHRAYDARHSRPYVDPTTSLIRETDVVGLWVASPPRWVYVYLVVECKSSPKPWVVFDDGEGLSDDPERRLEMAVSGEFPAPGRFLARVEDDNGLHKTLLAPSRIGTSVTAITGQKPDANTPNPAWSAVQAAVSAARGFQADIDTENPVGATKETYVGVLTFPVVVTTGGLYRSWLDAGNELQVEAVDRAEVTVRPTTVPNLTRCLIVTEAGLPDLCQQARETADYFGRPRKNAD